MKECCKTNFFSLLDGNINKNTITKIKKHLHLETPSFRNSCMNKKRRKELRNIYEFIKGKEYVEGLKKQPLLSSIELVDLLSQKK